MKNNIILKKSIQNGPNLEMKTVLKHDQLINYKVQCIAYCTITERN